MQFWYGRAQCFEYWHIVKFGCCNSCEENPGLCCLKGANQLGSCISIVEQGEICSKLGACEHDLDRLEECWISSLEVSYHYVFGAIAKQDADSTSFPHSQAVQPDCHLLTPPIQLRVGSRFILVLRPDGNSLRILETLVSEEVVKCPVKQRRAGRPANDRESLLSFHRDLFRSHGWAMEWTARRRELPIFLCTSTLARVDESPVGKAVFGPASRHSPVQNYS